MADTPQLNSSDSAYRFGSSAKITPEQQPIQGQEATNVVLSMPGPSEYQSLTVTPGMAFHLDFDLSRVTLDRLGHDLYLFFDQNATIVLRGFSDFETSSRPPVFFLPNGTELTTQKLFSLLEPDAMIEPAAGLPHAAAESPAQPAAHNPDTPRFAHKSPHSGGAGEYQDDSGQVLKGIDKLDGVAFEQEQGRAVDSRAALPGEYESSYIPDLTPPFISIDSNGQTNDTTPTISGHAEPGSTILVELGGVTMATITDSGGVWSVTVPDSRPLPEGLYTLSVTATDAVGNMATTSASIGVDATPPVILSAEVSDDGELITGTTEPDVEVVLTFPDGTHVQTTADGNGDFTIDLNTPLTNGENVTLVAQDSAGNPSEAFAAQAPYAPQVGDVDLTTNEDTAIVITPEELLANTIDPDSEGLTITTIGLQDPTAGTLIGNSDGNYIFTPAENFNGEDVVINFSVSDGVLTGSGSARIDVLPVSDSAITDDAAVVTEERSVTIDVLSNDTLEDGAVLSDFDTTSANGGTVTQNPDGTMSYTPAIDFEGIDTFSYTIRDADGALATATVTITVNDEGIPTAVNDAVAVIGGQFADIGVLVNDALTDGAVLTAFDITSASGGTITQNSDGTLHYTPPEGFVGTDTFTYSITDEDGSASTATVTLTVTAAGVSIAVNDAAITLEEQSVSIDVLNNDLSVDSAVLAAYDATSAHGGTITLNADGTLNYTPAANFEGIDTFTYSIESGIGALSTATVTVIVNDEGIPTAVTDHFSVVEDHSVDIDVLANDALIDGAALTAFDSVSANGGTITQNADGTLHYTPAANFEGTDTFAYTIMDEDGSTSTATVTITVRDEGVPRAVSDTVTIIEEQSVNIDVLSNDTMVDGAALTAFDSVSASGGTITRNPDGTLHYTPAVDFEGTDTFSYTITDEDGSASTAIVTITVNDQGVPTAVNDSAATVEELSINIDVLANDTLIDGAALTAFDTVSANGGVVTRNADGTLHYTPAMDFEGTDTFTYTLTDEDGSTATATVSIIVNDQGVPTAVNDAATTTQAQSTTINVLANDALIDGAVLSGFDTVSANGGTVTRNADGTLNYTPAAGFIGTDTFTYTIMDEDGSASNATVTIVVSGAGVPVAVADAAVTTEEQSVDINVLANDTLIDGATLTGFDGVSANGGTITQNADGTLHYTPATNFEGTDTFAYTITDIDGAMASATVTITVNDEGVPTAVNDSVATNEDQTISINVLANDLLTDGATLTGFDGVSANGGTITQNANGTLNYTPAANFSGTDTFTYTITDEDGSTSTATATVNVAPVNDAPVATNSVVTGTEETQIVFSSSDFNFSDVDGDGLASITIQSLENVGTLQLNGVDVLVGTTITMAQLDAGLLTYDPLPDGTGSGYDSFGYTVNDAASGTVAGTMTINVVDGQPVANSDTDTLFANGTELEGNVISGLGTDGGTASGDPAPPFATQGEGVDFAVDDAHVNAITYRGDVIDLTTSSSGANITASADGSTYSYTVANGQLTLTNADGSSLLFNTSGDYSYTPSQPPGHQWITESFQDGSADSGVTLSSSNGSIVFNSTSGVGVNGGFLDNTSRVNNGEELTIRFDPSEYPDGVMNVTLDNYYASGDSTVTVYGVDNNVLSSFRMPNNGVMTIPTQSEGIGRITIDTDVSLFGTDYFSVQGITFMAYDVDYDPLSSISENFADGSADQGTILSNPVVGDGFSRVADSGQYLSLEFDTQTHAQGVEGVVLNFDHSNISAGGSVVIYHIDGHVMGTLALAAAAIEIPSEYSNIGHIEIVPNSGSENIWSLAGVDFSSVTLDTNSAALQPEVIGYTLTDGDGQSDTATLTLNTIYNSFSGDESANNMTGTVTNDFISGLDGNDTIAGGLGHDILDGGDGNDMLYGEDGMDILSGGQGDDYLSGGSGDDRLYGNDGNDMMEGGTGNDHLDGGLGNDIMTGDDGQDTLIGGHGADSLVGGLDNDILVGGDGDDMLYGNAGDDRLEGGAGNDTLYGGDSSGGNGSDTFVWGLNDQGSIDAPARDTVHHFDSVTNGETGGDVLDLRDLLQGEDNNSLSDYLSFTSDGVDTTIHIDHTGGALFQETQQIVLSGVDLTAGGTLSDQDIINHLLTNNNLLTD